METREFVLRINEDSVRCGVLRIEDGIEFIYHRSQNDWLEHIHAYAKKVVSLPVFIHGLWGDKSKIYNKMVRKVSKDIFPDYPLVLHIIWEGRNTYRSNHPIIDEVFVPKITKLMIMVDKMLNRPTMNILAHSMGSRVAIQLFKNVMKGRNETQRYNFVVAAGDIPIDLCQEFVAEFIKEGDQFHVLYNPKDITLKLANYRKNYARLGLFGMEAQKDNVINHLIDKKKDEEIFLSSIFGHRYFYSSPSVRGMIKNIFLEANDRDLMRLNNGEDENIDSLSSL